MNEAKKTKASFFDNPILSSKIKSANVKLFPEGALGYLVGPALAIFSNAILNGYLNKYYTDVLNLTSWAKTFSVLLPIVSVICVIIGNLLVGKIMAKTRSKAGKARPLLLLSIPMLAVAIFLLFFAPYPNDDASLNNSMLTLIFVAIGYNLYYAVAYPFYYVSHSAMVNLSTRNQSHRGMLAVASNASGLAAVGLGCNMVFPLFQSLLFKDGDRLASYNAWRIFMIALILVTAIGILIEYYFTRERITEEDLSLGVDRSKVASVSMAKQAKVCLKDKYWWFILLFFLLYQLGGQLKNCSGTYYTQWMFADTSVAAGGAVYNSSYGGGILSLINTVGAIPTGVGMLIAWPLAKKLGKGNSIVLGSILTIAGGLLGVYFGAGNVYISVAAFVIKAIGSIPAMYVSLALLSDVLDHQEALYGFRTDGLTMSIYGSIMIGMNGLANGIINGLLSATGYVADAATAVTGQSEATKTALSWLFFGGEAICGVLILLMFLFMNVEKFSKLDHKAIAEHQKEAAEKAGVPYVDSETKLRLEDEKSQAEAEEARIAELKVQCLKKGKDFEAEEKAFIEKREAKENEAKLKKEKQEAIKEEKAKAKLEKEQAKEASWSEEEKAKHEEKIKDKKDKEEREEERLEKQYDALQEKASKIRASL
ncbi:MAG: MFS transporter [Bacilli bacterium]|jgi:GPH family glycoside/pentoside/hexuronide:cation symporter|nr:MFS transporter [Bacilli bacterium]MCI2055451.1 MFS transporter [Bacilli bacterium]